MNKKIKIKLDAIIHDLDDNGFDNAVPYAAVNNAIIRSCGINHNTILAYRNALLAFGYMSVKVPNKLWVINHGKTSSV